MIGNGFLAVPLLASLLVICRAGTCTITSFPPDNANPSSTDDYLNTEESFAWWVDSGSIACESKGEPDEFAFIKINFNEDLTSTRVLNVC